MIIYLFIYFLSYRAEDDKKQNHSKNVRIVAKKKKIAKQTVLFSIIKTH
jgi:hypothetical protein